jgi:hypothetical protein
MKRVIAAGCLLSPFLAFAPAAGCGSSALSIGIDDAEAGGPGFSGNDAGTTGGKLTVSIAATPPTLCPGQCAVLSANASAGTRPYAFAWSSSAATDGGAIRVCPSATTTYEVTVTDSSGHSGEFDQPNAASTAQVTVTVSAACIDGEPPDAGASSTCAPDAAMIAPVTVTPDYLDNAVAYFADGGTFVPGHYTVTYVSGCVRYNGYSNLTVNGQPTFEYLIVSDADAQAALAVAPGTVALGLPFGYTDLASCETANRALAPVDFDFDGGPLGIYNNDFQPSDNVIDNESGAPTWRLTGGCR